MYNVLFFYYYFFASVIKAYNGGSNKIEVYDGFLTETF